MTTKDSFLLVDESTAVRIGSIEAIEATSTGSVIWTASRAYGTPVSVTDILSALVKASRSPQ